VQTRRWVVEIACTAQVALQLSAVQLPGGAQRRRNASDELNMRQIFQEQDLIASEVCFLELCVRLEGLVCFRRACLGFTAMRQQYFTVVFSSISVLRHVWLLQDSGHHSSCRFRRSTGKMAVWPCICAGQSMASFGMGSWCVSHVS
jgi:hypothetical protein